ncbi:hypothetical protein [Mycolicibacterium peregrinum]|uniref:hypothetical protein n=1 Tax=Mycolicibacterium peregrinum TaxID=43304 RepID=UPI000B26B544|nr:hypothetical protein [Mycolicibacterium peregrinum]
MFTVPSAHADISRRRVLLSAAALALLGATAACSTTPPQPEVDDLTAQLDRARADSALAADAAAAQPAQAPVTRALNAVATDRSAHAKALADELTRMTGSTPANTTTATTKSTAKAAPGTGADPSAPSLDDVVDALRESADRAAGLARRLSGYRAGLLGSIAASCTAGHTVALGGAQ